MLAKRQWGHLPTHPLNTSFGGCWGEGTQVRGQRERKHRPWVLAGSLATVLAWTTQPSPPITGACFDISGFIAQAFHGVGLRLGSADRHSGETERERETGAYRNNQTGLRDLKAQERHPQTHGGVAVGPSFPWGRRKDSPAPIVE